MYSSCRVSRDVSTFGEVPFCVDTTLLFGVRLVVKCGERCEGTLKALQLAVAAIMRSEDDEDDMQLGKKEEATLLHSWAKLELDQGDVNRTRCVLAERH
jgi:hypothetical protein